MPRSLHEAFQAYRKLNSSGCLPGAATLAVCWGVRRNRSSWGSAGKDELQGRLDVTARGLQGSQAQLVVLDAHVT